MFRAWKLNNHDLFVGRKARKSWCLVDRGLTMRLATFHVHVCTIQANLCPRALLCYAIGGTGSLEKQVERGCTCKLWLGGCSLMGKCFLLQVRRTLALISRYRHDDSLHTQSKNRYRIQLFAAKFMLGKSRIASIADTAVWIWKDSVRYVEKYETLHEAKSQAIKLQNFFTIYRSEKKFEAILI